MVDAFSVSAPLRAKEKMNGKRKKQEKREWALQPVSDYKMVDIFSKSVSLKAKEKDERKWVTKRISESEKESWVRTRKRDKRELETGRNTSETMSERARNKQYNLHQITWLTCSNTRETKTSMSERARNKQYNLHQISWLTCSNTSETKTSTSEGVRNKQLNRWVTCSPLVLMCTLKEKGKT